MRGDPGQSHRNLSSTGKGTAYALPSLECACAWLPKPTCVQVQWRRSKSCNLPLLKRNTRSQGDPIASCFALHSLAALLPLPFATPLPAWGPGFSPDHKVVRRSHHSELHRVCRASPDHPCRHHTATLSQQI